MNTPGRLGTYGGILAVVFAASYALGGALVPDSAVQSWNAAAAEGHPVRAEGLSASANGYRLTGVETLGVVSTNDSALAFTVAGPGGQPVRDFDTVNGSDMHLVVVSADGSWFRHMHPELDGSGRWWLPWRWERGGTYRLFADFQPRGGPATVLSTLVTVPGTVPTPRPARVTRIATSEGVRVALTGDLLAGGSSTLTVTATRYGNPAPLEPYLGSLGHLVVLRRGDLAYVHAHARETGSPGRLEFAVDAPTEGSYLLFLELKVGGEVRVLPLALDTAGTAKGGVQDGHGH